MIKYLRNEFFGLPTKLIPVSVVAALGFALPSPSLAETPRDTLIMGWNIDNMVTLDPAVINQLVTMEILQNTCDMLVTYDPSDVSKIMPQIAESWTVSEDRLTITFKIRPGITFSSGNPVTAKDAAWSFHRASQMGSTGATTLNQYGFDAESIEQTISAPDDETLVMKLDRPYPVNIILEAIGAATFGTILDKTLVEKHEDNGDLGAEWLTTNTACSGPFNLTRWNAGELVLLEANEDYWSVTPELKRVLIRHIPEPGAQRLLLEQGDIDVARDLSSDDISDMEVNDATSIRATLLPQMFFAYLNNTKAPFNDPETRLAMRYLVDYQGLTRGVMKHLGVPRASFVQIGALGSLSKEEGLPFEVDIQAAKEHLAAAGLSDGFEATMLIGSHSFAPIIAQNIQFNAAKAGVNIKIEAMATPQAASRIRAHDYDMTLLPYRVNMSDPHGQASVFLLNPDPDDAKYNNLPSWRSGFHSERINQLVEEALFEPDLERRAGLYRDLQFETMQTGPYLMMFQLNSIMALSKEVSEMPVNSFRMYYNMATKN